jgi:hypothetical protein
MKLETVMRDKEEFWNQLVSKYNLRKVPYKDVSSWVFGDSVFSWDYDFLRMALRLAGTGFTNSVISEHMFLPSVRGQRISS